MPTSSPAVAIALGHMGANDLTCRHYCTVSEKHSDSPAAGVALERACIGATYTQQPPSRRTLHASYKTEGHKIGGEQVRAGRDSLPPSNIGMVFMKNSLEATWSASKTQMSSEPGTRVPGGYIWEHTLLMLPDLPFISPAVHCETSQTPDYKGRAADQMCCIK